MNHDTACIAMTKCLTATVATPAAAMGEKQWIVFPDARIAVAGLPWFDETVPELWRLPRRTAAHMPPGVYRLMRFPTGARLRFRSNTTTLWLDLDADPPGTMPHMSALGMRGLDVYVDGQYWASATFSEPGTCQLRLLSDVPPGPKNITVYLPTFQRLTIKAIGLDAGASLEPSPPFANPLPIVYYGSSIAQGACASRPGMSYEAILSRALGLDYVNLGFSGSGKAEPEVVELVAQLDACCYVLDLGKSFGMQPPAVYGRMLDTLRAAHPQTPIVCITPIFSCREFYSDAYRKRSEHCREAVRQEATVRIKAGDTRLFLVDGLELLGAADADAFAEGTHPSDLGFTRIAERLEPVIRNAVGIPPAKPSTPK